MEKNKKLGRFVICLKARKSFNFEDLEMTTTAISNFYHTPFNPSTGRFLSEDPIVFTGLDDNLYRYVFNNPVNFIDPNGLRFGGLTKTSDAGALGATIGGVIGVSVLGLPGAVALGFLGGAIGEILFPDRTGEGSELTPPRDISPSGTPCLPPNINSSSDLFEGLSFSDRTVAIPFQK